MTTVHDKVVLVLATLTPRAGQLETVLDLAQPVIAYAAEDEIGCFEFSVFAEIKPDGVEQLFTIERFRDEETLELHQSNSALSAFKRAVVERDLLQEDIVTKVVRSVAGFRV
ncbi:ABM domain-containing protein [Trichoderma simmonsii]|uniref:ABM domain-containing protein n=2 Tax=Trichoderma TaxID=5543 RepID=A0A1T3CXJ2_9HYPO|nr:hypothetical protein A0O28_0093870 [Trichoderma guizhouense]QYT03615.1 ABM domain-containing protein [Trichoderma simmonsii]